jgi:hypothetical protein
MPFVYEFYLNKKKIAGVENGFSRTRRWEEALDEAKLSLPFLRSNTPEKMYGILEIFIKQINNYKDMYVIDSKSFEMLIISDQVSPSGQYGYYRHNITAIEYSAKFDTYMISSLAKSRSILNNNPAPFEKVNNDLIVGGIDGGYRAYVWLPKLDVKTTYYDETEINFPTLEQAYQVTSSVTGGEYVATYTRRDVYISTNAPLISGTSPHNLSSGPANWVFPKGKWYIEYGFNASGLPVPLDIYSGNTPIYKFYIDVIQKDELSILDVLNSIRQSVSKFGGIETEEYYPITRLFNISPEDEEYLSKVQAPQVYLENATARQMLMFVLSYVNALPRIKLGLGIDILELEYYSKKTGDFDMTNVSEISSSQNTNQIGTRSYAPLNQVLPNDMDEPTTIVPSATEWVQVRSKDIQLTDSNFVIKLPQDKPIYMAKKLEQRIENVVIQSAFSPTEPVSDTIPTYSLDLTPRWINIEEWRLKEITNNFPTITTPSMWQNDLGLRKLMVQNLYWQMGDTEINLSEVYGTLFQENLINNVTKAMIFEAFMRDMPKPFIQNVGGTNYMTVSYDISYEEPTNHKELRFRVSYISDENLVIKNDKDDITQIDFYSEMRHNQDESIVNALRASRKIYGDLQRTGNQQLSFVKLHKSFSEVLDVGLRDRNGFTITAVNEIYYNDFILATYFITKHHNRIQQATFVDQTYRWRDNYAKNVLNRHDNYSDYLMVVPIDDENVGFEKTLIKSYDKTVRMAFSILNKGLYSDEIGKSKATVSLVRTDGMLETLQETESDIYFIEAPVSSFGVQQGLAFKFGFKGNQVAGDGLVQKMASWYNQAVRYTNEQGKFSRLAFMIADKMVVNNENYEEYPLLNYDRVYSMGVLFDCVESVQQGLVGVNPLIIDKDPMTNISITYQLNILSNNYNQFVFGRNFYANNFLVNDMNEKDYANFKPTLYIYTNGEKYDNFNEERIINTFDRKVELNTSNLIRTINVFEFNGIDLTDMTSWAIGDDTTGELIMACNDPLNGFKVIPTHFRPNVKEIGYEGIETHNESISLSGENEIILNSSVRFFNNQNISLSGQNEIVETHQLRTLENQNFHMLGQNEIVESHNLNFLSNITDTIEGENEIVLLYIVHQIEWQEVSFLSGPYDYDLAQGEPLPIPTSIGLKCRRVKEVITNLTWQDTFGVPGLTPGDARLGESCSILNEEDYDRVSLPNGTYPLRKCLPSGTTTIYEYFISV